MQKGEIQTQYLSQFIPHRGDAGTHFHRAGLCHLLRRRDKVSRPDSIHTFFFAFIPVICNYPPKARRRQERFLGHPDFCNQRRSKGGPHRKGGTKTRRGLAQEKGNGRIRRVAQANLQGYPPRRSLGCRIWG